jgi:hypothetical protein
MQSLELVILASFSLLIVFAAVPYIWQLASASMAQWEARQMLTFMASFADSLESDFGMPGTLRSYYFPNLVYGVFSVRNYTMSITCVSTGRSLPPVYSLFVMYNSSYITGGAKPLRGVRNVTLAPLGQPLAGLNATGLGYVLYTGPVYISGTPTVLYVFNVTVIRVSGLVSLRYRVVRVVDGYSDDRFRMDCPGGVFQIRLVNNRGRQLWAAAYRLGESVVVVATHVEIALT